MNCNSAGNSANLATGVIQMATIADHVRSLQPAPPSVPQGESASSGAARRDVAASRATTEAAVTRLSMPAAIALGPAAGTETNALANASVLHDGLFDAARDASAIEVMAHVQADGNYRGQARHPPRSAGNRRLGFLPASDKMAIAALPAAAQEAAAREAHRAKTSLNGTGSVCVVRCVRERERERESESRGGAIR